MCNIFKSLSRFFPKTKNFSNDLDEYIQSRNPKTIAEIEYLTFQYMNQEVRKNGFFHLS